jgi:hypothetical protein
MARIRSIKPEVRTSLVVGSWPRDIRYLWILLWGYLDDHGYGVDDARLVKADCLPLDDDVSRQDVDDWLKLIAVSGPLCRYEVDGRRYMHAPNWGEHQKPQHPKPSRVPACPLHDGGMKTTPDDPEESIEPYNDLHEDVMKPSGDPPEVVTPEQGAGRWEQGGGTTPSVSNARGRVKRGTRLPDPFPITQPMRDWARTNVPELAGRGEHDRFVDYWRAQPGQRGVKVDWEATWRNWMRTAAERLQRGPARASPNGSTTDQRVADALRLSAELAAEGSRS